MSKEINEGPKRKGNLLSTIDPNELKSIKVALRRNDVPSTSQARPLIRALDDPASLRVNLSGVRDRHIFYRDDVRSNLHEVTKDQFYSERERGNNNSSTPKSCESKPGPSRTPQRSGSLFGDYINSAPPFDLPPEEGSCCRHKQKNYHSKPPRRSRSRDGQSKSPSPNSKERCEDGYRRSRKLLRSRSRSKERRYSGRDRNYKMSSHHKEKSPPLRPGEYRPKKRKSKSRSSSRSPEHTARHYSAKSYKSRESSPSQDGIHKSYKRRSRSNSPRRNKYSESKSRRYSKSPESHRSHPSRELSPRYRGKRARTPTRPGEFRPRRSFSKDRHVTRSPPLRPGEYRPRKRSPNSPPLRPGEYRPPKHRNYYGSPPAEYIYYGDLHPGSMLPQFGHPSVPPIRPVYIPYPIFPMRPPFHPPMNRPLRPNIVYNNRQIPKLTPLPQREESSNVNDDEPDEPATDENKAKDVNESK